MDGIHESMLDRALLALGEAFYFILQASNNAAPDQGVRRRLRFPYSIDFKMTPHFTHDEVREMLDQAMKFGFPISQTEIAERLEWRGSCSIALPSDPSDYTSVTIRMTGKIVP